MKTKKVNVIAAGLLFFTSTCVGFAQTDSKKAAEKENEKKFEHKSENDAEFVVDAVNAGMFEVQASELAKTNASSPKVKELAEMMIKDHSKANAELKAIAAKKNITVPSKLGDKMQKEFDDLTKLKGAEFDKAYAKRMVKDHKDAIDLFKDEAEKGRDGELKGWASTKIAALQHHLEMAEATQDQVK